MEDTTSVTIGSVNCQNISNTVILSYLKNQIVCLLNLSASGGSLVPEMSYNLTLFTAQNPGGLPFGLSIYVLGNIQLSISSIQTVATNTPALLLGSGALMTINIYRATAGFLLTSIYLSVSINGYILSAATNDDERY